MEAVLYESRGSICGKPREKIKRTAAEEPEVAASIFYGQESTKAPTTAASIMSVLQSKIITSDQVRWMGGFPIFTFLLDN
jgi:hypothetical protein